MGINTALDLAESSLWVIKKLQCGAERTVSELRGCHVLSYKKRPNKTTDYLQSQLLASG
jgi:hypothetical protein